MRNKEVLDVVIGVGKESVSIGYCGFDSGCNGANSHEANPIFNFETWGIRDDQAVIGVSKMGLSIKSRTGVLLHEKLGTRQSRSHRLCYHLSLLFYALSIATSEQDSTRQSRTTISD